MLRVPFSLGRTTLLLALAAAALVAPLAASSAGATTLLTCPGSQSATFSPALTNTPVLSSIAVSGSFGPCVNAADPLELRTGTITADVPAAERSCTSLLQTTPGYRSISWSTGTTSRFDYTASASFVAGGAIQVVQDGTITSGEFAGKSAIGTVTLLSPGLLACSGAGVSQFGGPATLTIAG